MLIKTCDVRDLQTWCQDTGVEKTYSSPTIVIDTCGETKYTLYTIFFEVCTAVCHISYHQYYYNVLYLIVFYVRCIFCWCYWWDPRKSSCSYVPAANGDLIIKKIKILATKWYESTKQILVPVELRRVGCCGKGVEKTSSFPPVSPSVYLSTALSNSCRLSHLLPLLISRLAPHLSSSPPPPASTPSPQLLWRPQPLWPLSSTGCVLAPLVVSLPPAR